MKTPKISFKRIVLSLAGLKMCKEKSTGSVSLCSDRETSLGQLLQK